MFSEWSQPYRHLDPGQPEANRLILNFREGAVRNETLSADGPAVYDRLLQVRVSAIGQKQSQPIYTLIKITGGVEKIEEPLQYRRFKPTFDQWRQQQAPSTEGIPLEAWPLMTIELVRAFKDANILTVEDLAAASDSAAGGVKAEFFKWRSKAQAWLREAKEKGGDVKARAELAEAQEQIKALQAQVQQLLAIQNGAQAPAKGFDAPKRRRKNGAADDVPLNLPDEAMAEFDEDRV